VICLAWEQRKTSPMIRVQGGVNARLAQSTCSPRSDWGRLGDDPLCLGMRYDAPDFDEDVHYFLAISAGHPGTENWPCPTPRMRFPHPPHLMDDFVAACKARREQEERDHHTDEAARANPWVMLTGLRTSALNGMRGIRGAWDAGKERYAVQLTDGRTVTVKAANLVLCGLTPAGEPSVLHAPPPPPPPPPPPARRSAPPSSSASSPAEARLAEWRDLHSREREEGPWYLRDAIDLVDQALGYAYQREHHGVPSVFEERAFIEDRLRLGLASGQGDSMLTQLNDALARFRAVVSGRRAAGSMHIDAADIEMMGRALTMTLAVFFVPDGVRGGGAKKWGAHLQAWIKTTGLMGRE
jgi:hypothetical protein